MLEFQSSTRMDSEDPEFIELVLTSNVNLSVHNHRHRSVSNTRNTTENHNVDTQAYQDSKNLKSTPVYYLNDRREVRFVAGSTRLTRNNIFTEERWIALIHKSEERSIKDYNQPRHPSFVTYVNAFFEEVYRDKTRGEWLEIDKAHRENCQDHIQHTISVQNPIDSISDVLIARIIYLNQVQTMKPSQISRMLDLPYHRVLRVLSLHRSPALVRRPSKTQLCRSEVVNTVRNVISNLGENITLAEVSAVASSIHPKTHPCSISTIRTIIKRDVGLSYKVVETKPTCRLLEIHRRHLFWFYYRLCIALNSGLTLISVDEVSVTSFRKGRRGWGVRGQALVVHRKIYSQANITCVLMIDNTGSMAYRFVEKGILSVFFTDTIERFLQPYQGKEVVLLLDGCAAHKADSLIGLAKDKKATILWLPPYHPEYQPVELINGLLKAKLRVSSAATRTDSIVAAHDILKNIDSGTCTGAFRHVLTLLNKEFRL